MPNNASRGPCLGLLLVLLAACSADDTTPDDGAVLADAQLGTSADAAAPQDAAIAQDGELLDAAATLDGASADGETALDGASHAADSGAAAPVVDRSNPKLHEHELDPHLLDPSTADSPAIQYAQLDTRSEPLGQLVVFLPGANNVPRDWRDHGRKLAQFGFHVLIPHYNNRWSSAPNEVCKDQPKGCGDETRWEALTGEDSSAAIVIPRADSAEGRVVTMLKHLASAQPGGDWGFYLSDDKPAYARIIIAGMSHGAASTGMYAARRPFARAVMHSSGPAGSSSAAKMTPLSAWYGFVHTGDPAYSAITGAWNNFALPGMLTSVDGQMAPYGGAHRLTASATTATTNPHLSTCAHSTSPKDAQGSFVFEPVWRYLYGVPAQ